MKNLINGKRVLINGSKFSKLEVAKRFLDILNSEDVEYVMNKNIKEVILEVFPLSADDSFFDPKFTHSKEAIAAIQEWGSAWKAWNIIDDMLQKDWETTWKPAFENKCQRELKAGSISKDSKYELKQSEYIDFLHYKDTVKGDAVTVANWLLNNYASHWIPQWLTTATGKNNTIINNENIDVIKDSISKRIASLEEA